MKIPQNNRELLREYNGDCLAFFHFHSFNVKKAGRTFDFGRNYPFIPPAAHWIGPWGPNTPTIMLFGFSNSPLCKGQRGHCLSSGRRGKGCDPAQSWNRLNSCHGNSHRRGGGGSKSSVSPTCVQQWHGTTPWVVSAHKRL